MVLVWPPAACPIALTNRLNEGIALFVFYPKKGRVHRDHRIVVQGPSAKINVDFFRGPRLQLIRKINKNRIIFPGKSQRLGSVHDTVDVHLGIEVQLYPLGRLGDFESHQATPGDELLLRKNLHIQVVKSHVKGGSDRRQCSLQGIQLGKNIGLHFHVSVFEAVQLLIHLDPLGFVKFLPKIRAVVFLKVGIGPADIMGQKVKVHALWHLRLILGLVVKGLHQRHMVHPPFLARDHKMLAGVDLIKDPFPAFTAVLDHLPPFPFIVVEFVQIRHHLVYPPR